MVTTEELGDAIKEIYDKGRVSFADRVKILDLLRDIKWEIKQMRKVVEMLYLIANGPVDDYQRAQLLADVQEVMNELEIEVGR